MTAKLSWQNILTPEGRDGDNRWARLVPEPKADVEEQVRELGEDPPPGGADVMVVRGERCRDSQSLFREWASSLNFPDYFGRNWNAFDECLTELVERYEEDDFTERQRPDTVLILVLRSIELLRDESSHLRMLTEFMRNAAFGLGWEMTDKPRLAEMRIVFQCEPQETEALKERFGRVGLDL